MQAPARKNRLLLSILFLATAWLASPAAGWAGDQEIPYLARMPYRIFRGAANIALGWTEIVLRPFAENETESAGEAISKGAAHTLMRYAAGVIDLTTFWVPDIRMEEIYPDWESWPYLFHRS